MTGSRNRITGLALGGVAIFMIGAAFAAVPLYRILCQTTGFAGTAQTVDAMPEANPFAGPAITVDFDANVSPDLAWSFKPRQRRMDVRVGEPALAYYGATNQTARRIAGTATFNVTPAKAAAYFFKVECFCFSEQVLEPGETAEMPVSFFIHRDFADDPHMKDVKTITLSYTFFRSEGLASAGQKRGEGRNEI
jgi:cytochrome c oxidase assembly protein subunit 11